MQYENGHNTLKIHELNARLINPVRTLTLYLPLLESGLTLCRAQDQAALLAGGDLRQLLAQFSAKIGGVKKEIVVLNDGIMVLKQVSSSDNKLEYESLTVRLLPSVVVGPTAVDRHAPADRRGF